LKLIVIFGPAAVGKTTVGIELSKLIGYKLFHNHVLLDPLYDYYTFADEQLMRLTCEFRSRLFEEFGKSNFKGIIFTYVWALDEDDDHKELLKYINLLNIKLSDVLFVELESEQKERLYRNKTELRLQIKKSKRNIEESEYFLIESDKKYKMNSNGDFFYPNQHIKIINTKLSPVDVAHIIQNEMNIRSFT